MITVPAPVQRAIDMLENAEHEAYIVGGCVRDALMGIAPTDYDITTSALPNDVKRVFSSCRVIETGIKHGTVTVLMDGMPLEITTYRVDAGYKDHRHPDSVSFTRSLKCDLARRDFTMNAIAYNPRRGIADYFGGAADIKDRVIRCVGDPGARFTEDALRMLRALRFSSVLGFRIDAATGTAIHEKKQLLSAVSMERIASELIKLLCGEGARGVIMEYIDVLGVPLPQLLPMRGFEQRSKYHIYDVLEHTARVIETVPPEPALRLAALLHDIGKPSCFTLGEDGAGHFYGHPAVSERMADEMLTALKLDNATKNRVITLVKYHDMSIEPTVKSVTRALGKLGGEVFYQLLAIKRADCLAQSPDYRGRLLVYDELEALAGDVLDSEPCLTVKQLAVNGNDLIEMGIPVGKRIGRTLKWLLDKVIAGDVENERERLIEYIRENVK